MWALILSKECELYLCLEHECEPYLCLDHECALCPECADSLEEVHHALVLHPLQHDGEADEHSRPPHPGTETNYNSQLS